MLSNLVRNWWLFALRGVFAIVFGVVAFVWPEVTRLALVLWFGAYLVLDAILALVIGIGPLRGTRWWPMIVTGLVGIVAGALILIWPDTAARVVLYFTAAWAIGKGVFDIAAAITFRREITNEWALALSGAAAIALGVLLVAFPEAGLVSLTWAIGAYSLFVGGAQIVLAYHLRSLHNQAEALLGTHA
jgi:uncharacterized membrane protein HdeD (DUF308 family)